MRPGAHIGCYYLWSEIAVVVHIQDRPARVLVKHPARRARTIGKQGQQAVSHKLSVTEERSTPTNPRPMAVGRASVRPERTWRSARAVRPAPTERTLAKWKSRSSAKEKGDVKISAIECKCHPAELSAIEVGMLDKKRQDSTSFT